MPETNDLIALTVDVVSAYVGQTSMRAEDVPSFIAATFAALSALGAAPSEPTEPVDVAPEAHEPKVTARKSLASKDHIISMIDGKPYKMLKRHLSQNGLTPEQYRTRYKLPASYPMVAENYATARREMAKRIGLGRKPNAPAAEAAPSAVAAPGQGVTPPVQRRGRKPKADAA